MADFVFNVAKGRGIEFWKRVDAGDPGTSRLILVLLKDTGLETDAILKDYDNLSALLTAANTECDFTNYTRIVYTAADLADPFKLSDRPARSATLDDTNDRHDGVLPTKSIVSAGGATNNTISKAVLCYAPDSGGADTTFIPIAAFDANTTTNGQDLNIPGATVYRAGE